MKRTKDKKGITLISLVITIIVMLILVSVTISIALGENGIIGKAREANKKSVLEEEREILISAVTGAYNVNTGEVDGLDLKNELGKEWTIKGDEAPWTCISPTKSTFKVALDGTISNVSIPVTVVLNKTETKIAKGSTETLIATIEPSDTSNQNLIWSSNDDNIATVNQNGDVKALVSSGTAVITVRTEDGNCYATCTVTCTDSEANCFAKGTKITIENGLTKNIEDITLGDKVLTFNHEAGIYEFQEVYFTWKGNEPGNTFTLNFNNGKSISIVGKHDLFEKESLKYVTITDKEAETFIGKHFYSVEDSEYVELLSITREPDKVEYFSIYIKNNVNCIANGMISVPDDADEILNIYKFNADLTIDHEQLDLDVKKYGIFEYYVDMQYTQEEYDFMNLQYLNISTGKGLTSLEELFKAKEEYLGNR